MRIAIMSWRTPLIDGRKTKLENGDLVIFYSDRNCMGVYRLISKSKLEHRKTIRWANGNNDDHPDDKLLLPTWVGNNPRRFLTLLALIASTHGLKVSFETPKNESELEYLHYYTLVE